ncbi:unnamed protein product [Phytomonas sp. Hart1]|nr:unnamed protein product [Phytomonas sp. Hart1]|eukprot:CCW69968.1 unnamed protein product [Phytomonas sp. isolate Hart1]
MLVQSGKWQDISSISSSMNVNTDLKSRIGNMCDHFESSSKKSKCLLKTHEMMNERNQDDVMDSTTYKDHIWSFYNNDPSLPLYRIENVPLHLRDNKYIITGYRAYYNTKMCFLSIFRLHNETINIWTHLAGALIFVVLIVYLFRSLLIPDYFSMGSLCTLTSPSEQDKQIYSCEKGSALPFIIFGIYSFGCIMCMVCSTCYHTFIGHINEKLYDWVHMCDYFGITFLVVGSFVPFCYYVLSQSPFWRNVYLGMIFSFGTVGLLGPFFQYWASVAFANKKILFYVCMVSSGMFPIFHIAFLLPKDVGSPYLMGLFMMMLLYGIGVFFYVFKLPEVFYPGKFDIYLSSHQIWHMFVLAAALTHFFNCIRMYADVGKTICTINNIQWH